MRRSRSTPTSRFSGAYADDGKAVRSAAREAAGNRCIRCLHPYQKGNGNGGWSPCDEQCVHRGPFRFRVFDSDPWDTSHDPGDEFTPIVADCFGAVYVEAKWRILTVHHFDGDKANDAWWNLMSLCQRCHLQIQGKVDPRIPYFFEHSEWAKPYIAGFYGRKYEGRNLTRVEVMDRLDDLLAYEHRK